MWDALWVLTLSTPHIHRLYAGASKSLSTALTVGGVAHDVIYEWLTLRISTTVKGPLPQALTLLC